MKARSAVLFLALVITWGVRVGAAGLFLGLTTPHDDNDDGAHHLGQAAADRGIPLRPGRHRRTGPAGQAHRHDGDAAAAAGLDEVRQFELLPRHHVIAKNNTYPTAMVVVLKLTGNFDVAEALKHASVDAEL